MKDKIKKAEYQEQLMVAGNVVATANASVELVSAAFSVRKTVATGASYSFEVTRKLYVTIAQPFGQQAMRQRFGEHCCVAGAKAGSPGWQKLV